MVDWSMFLVSSSDLTFVAGVAVTGLCWNYDTQEELFIFYSQCFFAGAMALVYLLCLLALLVVVLKAEELTLLLLPIDLLPQHIPFSRRRKKGDSKELQMTVCAYDRMKIGYYLAMQVFTTCVAWFAFHRHQYTAALLFHGSLSLMAILSEEFVWVHLFGCCCDKKDASLKRPWPSSARKIELSYKQIKIDIRKFRGGPVVSRKNKKMQNKFRSRKQR